MSVGQQGPQRYATYNDDRSTREQPRALKAGTFRSFPNPELVFTAVM